MTKAGDKMTKVRIRTRASDNERLMMSERFKEFVGQAGGALSVARESSLTKRYILNVCSCNPRVISPAMATRLVEVYKGRVDPKFTREYLRPDVSEAQWQLIDAQMKSDH